MQTWHHSRNPLDWSKETMLLLPSMNSTIESNHRNVYPQDIQYRDRCKLLRNDTKWNNERHPLFEYRTCMNHTRVRTLDIVASRRSECRHPSIDRLSNSVSRGRWHSFGRLCPNFSGCLNCCRVVWCYHRAIFCDERVVFRNLTVELKSHYCLKSLMLSLDYWMIWWHWGFDKLHCLGNRVGWSRWILLRRKISSSTGIWMQHRGKPILLLIDVFWNGVVFYASLCAWLYYVLFEDIVHAQWQIFSGIS